MLFKPSQNGVHIRPKGGSQDQLPARAAGDSPPRRFPQRRLMHRRELGLTEYDTNELLTGCTLSPQSTVQDIDNAAADLRRLIPVKDRVKRIYQHSLTPAAILNFRNVWRPSQPQSVLSGTLPGLSKVSNLRTSMIKKTKQTPMRITSQNSNPPLATSS